MECEPRLETSLSQEATLPPRRPCNQDHSRAATATYDTRMETDSVLITVEEAAVSIAIVV